MKIFRPMLACSDSCHHYLDELRFPLLVSPKIDGIRGTVLDGVVKARSGDPLRNINLQAAFRHFDRLDGEFALGDPTRHDLCRATGSVTNSKDKPIDGLKFYVFDYVTRCEALTYSERAKMIKLVDPLEPLAVLVKQTLISNVDELLELEATLLDIGYEGAILRDPNGTYKNGRSTAREQSLLKLKRFVDGEFEIVGFYERMANNNEATVSALGRTKRSSHKENKEGREDLGGLILKWDDSTTFRCGTGYGDALRQEIWDNQKKYKGKMAKIKYFAKGMKDLPRHPCFLSIRDKRDM